MSLGDTRSNLAPCYQGEHILSIFINTNTWLRFNHNSKESMRQPKGQCQLQHARSIEFVAFKAAIYTPLRRSYSQLNTTP